MAIRKDLTKLTAAERQAFVNAVLELKASGGYDTYVEQHRGASGHGHQGPAFFPWHREYIRRFELDLQAIDSSVNLPYWDWTVENLNSAGTASLIWSDDLMGGPGDPANDFAVTTGPFADWGLRRNAFDIFQSPGGGGDIMSLMAEPNYTAFRGIESPHGGAHIWVGGNMGNVALAPEDPTFWLLHCNVDRLWAEWTSNMSGRPDWVQYAPTSGGPTGHNLNDTMWPWNGTTNPFVVPPWDVVPEDARPAYLLDHRAIGIYYDTIDLTYGPVMNRKSLVPPEGIPKLREEPPKLAEKPGGKDFDPKESGIEPLPRGLLPQVPGRRLPIEPAKVPGTNVVPKDLLGKEPNDPKELWPNKEVGDPKERLGKEPGDIKERMPNKEWDPKERVPEEHVFIQPELRPSLDTAALRGEPDVAAELDALQARVDELRRHHLGDQ